MAAIAISPSASRPRNHVRVFKILLPIRSQAQKPSKKAHKMILEVGSCMGDVMNDVECTERLAHQSGGSL